MNKQSNTTSPEWLGWPNREAWEAQKLERHLEWVREKRAFLMRAISRGYATINDLEVCK